MLPLSMMSIIKPSISFLIVVTTAKEENCIISYNIYIVS